MSILKYKTVVVIDQALTCYAARRHRESSRLSIRKVANEMGVSSRFLSDLEQGKHKWTRTNATLFAWAIETLLGKGEKEGGPQE